MSLQQFYFPAYVRSTVLNALGFTKPPWYALLTVVDRRGPRPAVDTDVETLPGSSENNGFTLTPLAKSAGIRGLALTRDRYHPEDLQAFLLTSI